MPQVKRNHPTPVDPAEIRLSKDKVAIIDSGLFCELSNYYWRAVKSHECWYAVRRINHNGIVHAIRMHRQIAQTPAYMDCHHINGNSLDNRRSNLLNCTPEQHRTLNKLM